jgi:pseudo-rSAM protein
LNIEVFHFQPYFNEKNHEFFKSNVFIDKKDFNNSPIPFKDILKNGKINLNYFGRLIISNKGDIYTSFHCRKIGNMKDDLKNTILNEMKKNTSWRILRKNYLPCKSCTYELLCPPISDLERSMGRNNLCFIKD